MIWARRLVGLGLILVFLLTYVPEYPVAWRLVSLVVGVAGLWLALANVPALGLTVGLLATAHSQPGGADLISGWVYPLLAVAGLGAFAVIVAQRFVAHMHATHEARWAPRRAREGRSRDHGADGRALHEAPDNETKPAGDDVR